jgi:hypothetical protein
VLGQLDAFIMARIVRQALGELRDVHAGEVWAE